MKLSEIFDQLTFGELSQISIGGGEQGVIDPTNYNQVLAHVNLGLNNLYKRFPLKEGRVTVPLVTGTFTYVLTEDLHKIERVYTDAQYELGLNDLDDMYAIATPSASVLRVPSVIVENGADLPDQYKTTALEVVYRSNHPRIVNGVGFDPATTEVELPYSHLEPLLLFIASRVNNPMGMTNEFNAGNNYAAKYEKACQLLEITNLRVDQGSQPDRIQRNGWV